MLTRRKFLLGGTAITATTVGGSAIGLQVAAARQPFNLPVSDEVVTWLKANALPLATAEPGNGFADIEFLRATVGDARIVSLGEATHATHEFFQLKRRVIEYCITELGFTMVAFEAYFGTTLAVNDYVLYGKGSAEEAVATMGFWIWNTEEVIGLVEWIRAWNLAHERKVKFYGFDMQDCRVEGQRLFGYLNQVAPALATTYEPILAQLPPNAWTPLEDAARERVLAQIADVLATFDSERAAWVSQSSEIEWHLARQCAVVMVQCIRCPQPMLEFMTWRDRSMAENVGALLAAEGPDVKALLWAHNGHVQRIPDTPGTLAMGGFLHDAFGAQQVVIGFSFNQGSFRIPAMQSVGPAPAGYLDAALARTGLPLLALDLTRVPASGPVAAWMATEPCQRGAGAGRYTDPSWYTPRYWVQLFYPPFTDTGDPREKFNILIFVDTSTPSRPVQDKARDGANV
jgi:erythromycin esterase